MKNKVFITYSWDDANHKQWVKNLADKLIANGIDVLLDQYELAPGDSFTQFMETSIVESEKIIVVLTPNYRKKSTERKGGVGYEQQIISGEIMNGIDRRKFIPIIKTGEHSGDNSAIPIHFSGIVSIDFRNDNIFDDSFDELIRAVYQEPKLVKPSIGSKPNLGAIQTKLAKKFKIDLDYKFNCLQSTIVLTDIFAQIVDLKQQNLPYEIEYTIGTITETFNNYEELSKRDDLTEAEISQKLTYREFLKHHLFSNGKTIYDYLNLCVEEMIQNCFIKHHYLSNVSELCLAITKCYSLFSNSNYQSRREQIGFDVFDSNNTWNFRINLSKEEVDNLAETTKIPKHLLVSFAGLDIFNLSLQTRIEQFVPRLIYFIVFKIIEGKIDEETKIKYFNATWKIGLA